MNQYATARVPPKATGRVRHLRPPRAVILLLAYAGVTFVLASPFVDYRRLASACYGGDVHLIVWTLAWDCHALLEGLPLFAANIYYPAANALAYNEHLFGLALFYLPPYALTLNPVLAYNLVWLAAWLLNGVSAHLLARRYVGDDLAAFVGGTVFAFSFFRMHHFAHLGLAWTFWMPLSLLALDRWYRSPTWHRAGWLVTTVAFQVLTNWYLATFELLAVTLFLACLGLFGRQRTPVASGADTAAAVPAAPVGSRASGKEPSPGASAATWERRGALHLAAALVLLAILVWPFAAAYRDLARADASEAARYSADLAAFLIPPENTWHGRALVHAGWVEPRSIYGERTLFLGFVALALSGLGAGTLLWPLGRRCLPGLDRPAAVFFPLLALLALGLSLGPATGGTGRGVAGMLPFDWLSRLPGVSGLRAPARFTLLILLAMSVLAATGAAWLHRRCGTLGRTVTVLLIPLMLSEWYVVGFAKPTPDPIPQVYRYLARVPARAIVSLPMHRSRADWWREPDYLYYSTAHWHPIVNGAGRSEPAGYFSIVGHMMAFAGPNSARTMRRLGIDYVVLHTARSPGAAAMLEEALSSRDFRLEWRSGTDYLFRVVPR